MAKKKKDVPKPPREMTRRRMANWQKQRRRQRLILFGGIALITAAVLVVLIGWVVADAIPRSQKVLTVNDQSYDAGEITTALLYFSGGDAAALPATLNQMLPVLENIELIAQGAAALGVSVTDAEVKAEAERLGWSREYRRIVRLDLMEQRVRDHFEAQVPETAPQRHVFAMLLESQDQAVRTRQEIVNGLKFADMASLVAVDTYSQEHLGDTGWHIQGILQKPAFLNSSVPADWAWQADAGALSPPLQDDAIMKPLSYWIWKVTERNEAQGSHLYGLMLGSLVEAQNTYDRLLAGTDFAALAGEVSRFTRYLEGSPGEVGWYLDDQLLPSMEAFVLDKTHPLNSVSRPVRDTASNTNGGYWLVQVAEIDEFRDLTEGDRQNQYLELYGDWAVGIQDNPATQIERFLDADKQEWIMANALAELGQ